MTTGGSDENQKSKLEGAGSKFPAGRTGQEADIANAVLYLGSRAGTFVNGETIHVDGGVLLQSPSTLHKEDRLTERDSTKVKTMND
ncbi:hypothetical protein GTR04_3256 [Trichophyton interdigitale]|uniref:Uncharacterized protein n=1 Tax=Trichophyton interdigitale TaxID=101480 RepID=A0A9P5CW58_9EURO|nr:hypothetical protein GY631_2867 [Trichophyton interdigitale]KAF3896919.1 hypothetical protein GY632_2523 [Trichophyton interdigitale]KAG8209376.1 hypothetical protein GTR04_3256 [Trichophyton interdigitale]